MKAKPRVLVKIGGGIVRGSGGAKLFDNTFFRRSAIVLLASAVILSLFLVFFQMFQSSMIQSLSQMNSEFVEQVDTISGTLLDIINNTAMQMFYSRSVKTLRTATGLTNAQRTAGLRELGNQVSSSTFLSSAMIYNSNTHSIFTSEGGHASEILFHDRTAAQLLISRTKHGSSAPIKTKIGGEECYSFLFFEPNIPDGGSLLLNVRADWYERQLLGISSGYNSVVLNEEGEILVAGSELLAKEAQQIWPTLLEGFDHDSGHGFILHSDGKSGWMYYRLSNLGWYYLRSFDTETILPGMTRMRDSALGMLAVVFVLLVCGTFYTLFVLYMPLKKVYKTLRKVWKDEETMVQQVDKLLESQFEQLLAEHMVLLLQGKEDDSLTYPATLILTDSEDSEAVRSVVSTSTSLPSLTAKSGFGSAVIVSGCTEDQGLELCLNIADAIGCRCLYGDPRESAQGLAECHHNLLELWQLRFLHVGQQVLSEKLISTHQASLDFQTKDVEPLLSALRAGQLEEARACWKDIFEKIRYGRFGDFRFTVRYIFKRLTALQTELGLEPSSDSRDIVDDLEDVKDLHQTLDRLFVQIAMIQDDRRKKELNQLATRINERIAAGYDDEALSAQHIADEMGMNAVYLGRLYRESTGMSIGEAIKRIRVEHAKQLLLSETSEPIKNIASKVGFANTKYFFVVFKEIVGMTPKTFQNRKH